MKIKLTILLILVILFAGFIGIKFVFMDTTNAFGKLKITSSPTTSVFINGVAIGKTPYEDKYKVGEYMLKLIPEGMATQTASWNGKIQIYKNALTYVNRELAGSDVGSAGEVFTITKMDKPGKSGYGEIYVETEPQGAIVTLDNDDKGVASLIMSDVIKGDHEISVYMPGFLRRTQKVNVDQGYRVNAYFKLALDSTQITPTKTVSDNQPVSSDSAEIKKNNIITIKDTPQGWLRVREDASIDASESAKVKPGEKYNLLEEKDGWYKIKFNGNTNGLESGTFNEGWVSAQYSTKE